MILSTCHLAGDLETVRSELILSFTGKPYTVVFNANGGWYIGAGGGCIIANYNFLEGKMTKTLWAAHFVTGINIARMIDLSYTVQTNFNTVSHKLSVGYVYRF